MREIKFKFWHIPEKEMIPNEKINKNRAYRYLLNEENEREYIIPLQYTGLKDKNGVEIYEGDILKVDESRYDSRVKNRIYTTREVIYNDGGFIISQSAQRIYEYSRIEVIGNIHSNPELLK